MWEKTEKNTTETITNNNKNVRITTVPEYAAIKSVKESKLRSWLKQNRITTLGHQGKLFVDEDESKELKETSADEHQLPSFEISLKTLLERAEASARQNYTSRKKWQLLSFVSLMLLSAALYTVFWINMSINTMTENQNRLHMDNYALTNQLHSADAKVSEVSRQLDLLRSQNSKLAMENAAIKTQNSLLHGTVEFPNESARNDELKLVKNKLYKPQEYRQQRTTGQAKQRRLNAIKKGFYPEDMTKAELTESLGEPDRTYKGQVYEQLVYFKRSPGRFWFKKGPFLEASQ